MAQFPAMTLWTDAYLADTVHLSVAESGAYLHLLIAAWRTDGGHLPNDDKKLRRFARCTPNEWRHVREAVMEFWTATEDGKLLSQKRLNEELKRARNRSSKARHAINTRWLKTNKTGHTDVSSEKYPVDTQPHTPAIPSTATVVSKKESPLPPLKTRPNGLAPPASLFGRNGHGDELVPFSSQYETSEDHAIEAQRIVEWYGRLVSDQFARPPRQPYPGYPNEGKRGDFRVAKSWVARGFNCALAHDVFYKTLAAKCRANEQPPRTLSFFENQVSEFIAANPAMFSYRGRDGHASAGEVG